MPDTQSFDITTGCDLQEVDNGINQAQKELAQRYDFRNLKYALNFKRAENMLEIEAPDAFVLDAIYEILQAKLIKRGVPVKNLQRQDAQPAAGNSVRQQIKLQQVVETDTAKKIVKFVKDQKLKKVQAAIQKDQVRVSSPSRDDLQQAMQLLQKEDFGIELTFGNYR
jgi:uncharacterized protein YajQ (UPF0234 family)